MGLNAAGLGLMALARASGADFARVLTIGRQSLDLSPQELQVFFQARGRGDIAAQLAADTGPYCERLIETAFGAAAVRSLDASDYEQASIVHDMNAPIALAETFSVVIDFGTLEHVFNIAVAFDNVARLCAQGGFILHMLPANNLVGHGFYQFSPELFFQIYSPERGFAETRVFAAPEGTPQLWYEVRAPRELGRRVNLTSRDQLYLLAMTRKQGAPAPLTEQPVQQSDYLQAWDQAPPRAGSRRRIPLESALRNALNGVRHRIKVGRKDVAARRSDVTPRRVLELTARF